MYVDGWMLFAIYFIAVSALAVSVYALWSLEEIRKYYQKFYEKRGVTKSYTATTVKPASKVKGIWD